MSQSLFIIERALADLCETRQELEEQPAYTPEQVEEKHAALDAVDAAIVEYITAEVRKVDNIARFLTELKAREKALDYEIDRLSGVRDQATRTQDRIKAVVLQVMRDCDVKKLEGKIGSLKRQGNGGVQPVEIVQEDLIPEGLKRYSITMKGDLLSWLLHHLRNAQMQTAIHPLALIVLADAKGEPDKEAIREALLKRDPCPKCRGAKTIWNIENDGRGISGAKFDCDECKGAGDVGAGVPGARLAERGEHLRVG